MHIARVSFFVLLVLAPVALAASCSLPQGLRSFSATYGTTITSDIVVNDAFVVDASSITAMGITVSAGGKLYFDTTKSISLSANFILIDNNGGLYIGSEDCPYTQKATITLTGQGVVHERLGGNFLGVVAGGVLELHGAKGLGRSWTKLASTAAAGATSIQLVESVSGWQAGDRIVIATTDYSPLQNEVVTVTSVSGKSVSFLPALKWSHFGEITHNVDERGEVGLLTRNILIQGKERGYYGGHLMIMRGFSQAHIEGVEFNNMGQDEIARYPIHFHLCGDVPTGTYVKYNSVHDSNFRCVTIHATNGVLLEGNVAYNTLGHCYFLEDGVEQNNVLRGNLAILTRPKDFGQRIGSDASNTGLSSYWITNPQNVIEDNVAVGSYTAGFWFITRLGARGAAGCMPQYQNLPYRLSNLKLQSFKGNSAHSCGFGLGIESTNWDSGDVPASPCDSFVANWEPKNDDGSLAWTRFESFTAHHIRDRGVWARMPNIIVVGGRFADNYESVEYATSGDHPSYSSQQIIQDSIIVGFSDNKGNKESDTLWQTWDNTLRSSVPPQGSPMNGIKIYDGPQVIVNTVFVNFPAIPGRPKDAPIGARIADQSQVATTNYMKNVEFINSDYRFKVIDDTMDGGISANFRDVDGSVTGYLGGTALRNFGYYRTTECKVDDAYMMVCPHSYAQMWVLDMTANGNNNNMIITRSDHADANHANYALQFKGFVSGPAYRYQPIVSIGSNYLVRFQNHVPSSLVFQLNNAEVGDSVGVAVCYPLGTVITAVQRGYANWEGNAYPMNLPKSAVSTIPPTGSPSSTSSDSYYFDQSRGILFINLRQRNARTDYGNFCPKEGCDWVWVYAQFTVSAEARDCTQEAYNSGFLRPTSSWLNQKLVVAPSVPSVLQSILSSAGPVSAATTAPTRQPTAAPTAVPTSSATSAPTTTTTKRPSAGATTPAPTASSTPQCTVTCPAGLSCCGDACYSADLYQCNNGNKLCAKGLLSCGSTCYPPSAFTCVNSELRAL